jgi:hypothetical protein
LKLKLKLSADADADADAGALNQSIDDSMKQINPFNISHTF